LIETRRISETNDQSKDWLAAADLVDVFQGQFSQINPMNVPGPLYGAETDTCTTGPDAAPFNVLLDQSGQEFVFKQPSNAIEFRDILCAAIVECFSGYGCDGDAHWRLSTIREWWRNRDQRETNIHEGFGDPSSVRSCREGFRGTLIPYLRIYGFFVENGRVPVDADALPEI